MSRLGFRCSYTKDADADGYSPCGREATRRAHGEPKCMGHWVIQWLVSAYGGGHAARARSVYGFFFAVMFVTGVVQSFKFALELLGGTGGEYTAAFLVANASVAGVSGGIALGFVLGHPLGGMLWLMFAPMSSAALLFAGKSLLSGANPAPTSRLADVLSAFSEFVVAVAVLGGWLVFLLEYGERYRWATRITIVCEVLGVVVVVMGAALALVSWGLESGMLVMSVVLICLAVVVRGITRLKKLVKIIRV